MPALNLRYLAAIILLDGRLDFVSAQSLQRMGKDDAAQALMARVEIRHDPEQEIPPPAPRPESARVTVHLENGRRESAFVPHVLGYPTHPMSRADVEAKAGALMAPALGAERSRAVIAACADLDALPEARRLIELIAR
jgi:2-methylcitrate dehydratase PrpD